MREQTTTEPFVVRRTGLGTTTSILYLGGLLVALELLLTLACVVVAQVRDVPMRGPLESVWLSWGGTPLIFAIGLPILIAVGAITTTESRRESDSDDVLLCVDDDRVYLGGDQPQSLPWEQVHGLCRVERREVDAEGEESWEQQLIVLTHPETELAANSRAWGPSRDWPGSSEVLGRPLEFESLVEAVRRRAPQVPVTDRGRVLD
ncbi:hypothetical protein [Kribbella sp. CA-293567]|uniref:hypothetical protein n=1 Tax=Kribbella sp. CA-293567 TaxID=3002436 RepID=UPI0022DD8B03|nr:hypothetical protein [Kribbella sp. CA-293567]WBQ03200.1 hypothetical protein OX958_24845 [Kribbella sp. CA-293567]